MVRLKDIQVTFRITPDLISIPYGAIKSDFADTLRQCEGISIPYGAIKREILNLAGRMISHFNSLWCD